MNYIASFYKLFVNEELTEEKIVGWSLDYEDKTKFLEEFRNSIKIDNSFSDDIELKRNPNKEYECFYFTKFPDEVIGIVYKYNGLLYDYRSNLIKKKLK